MTSRATLGTFRFFGGDGGAAPGRGCLISKWDAQMPAAVDMRQRASSEAYGATSRTAASLPTFWIESQSVGQRQSKWCRRLRTIRTFKSMTGLLIGYARVSTNDQDLTAQKNALVALGVTPEKTFTDQGLTGANRARPGLREALAACRAGHTLVVTKLDRLARSLRDAKDRPPRARVPRIALALALADRIKSFEPGVRDEELLRLPAGSCPVPPDPGVLHWKVRRRPGGLRRHWR
jgi:hypothetical protein